MKHTGTKPSNRSLLLSLIPLAWILLCTLLPLLLIMSSASNSQSEEQDRQAVYSRAGVAELEQYRAAQEDQLGSYGWVDRGAGLVRVPIAEGMRRVLQEGLPARGEEEDQR